MQGVWLGKARKPTGFAQRLRHESVYRQQIPFDHNWRRRQMHMDRFGYLLPVPRRYQTKNHSLSRMHLEQIHHGVSMAAHASVLVLLMLMMLMMHMDRCGLVACFYGTQARWMRQDLQTLVDDAITTTATFSSDQIPYLFQRKGKDTEVVNSEVVEFCK